MRIIFFGTPDFAVASLQALVENDKTVVAVVTAPDKPAGRGHKLQAPPVKEYAVSKDIPVLQPTNLKDEAFITELASYQADLQIVVAFRMLPEVVWNMPEHGTYNVHGSLLPNYRGAAPINWAIINGERVTGVTTFKLKHEIDTGNILGQKELPIGENETVGDIYSKLMKLGAELLIESVNQIEAGEIKLLPQPAPKEGTHAPKIFKQDCKINVHQSAQKVHNFIRGLSPFPGAFLEVVLEDGSVENWKIYETKKTESKAKNEVITTTDGQLFLNCEDAQLEIRIIQTPGKKKLNAADFLRGNRVDLSSIKLH